MGVIAKTKHSLKLKISLLNQMRRFQLNREGSNSTEFELIAGNVTNRVDLIYSQTFPFTNVCKYTLIIERN